MGFWITTFLSRQLLTEKECAIYCNSVVDDSIIKCTLDILLKALGGSHIAHEYGFEPPKVYEYQLFMLPYLLGFLRGEIEYALICAGYEPKHLRLLQGKNALNSGSNIVGTHGNVILKTEVGGEPLTFINVSTNRGTFKLTLERKDFYASSAPKDTTQSASTEHNSLHKTRLCTHHTSGNTCYSGINCSFAHGISELRTKEPRARRVFTHAPVPSSEGLPTDNVQSGFNTADVIYPDLMATDEAQPSDGTFIEPTSGPEVEISEVNNSIIGGGNLVLGSLSEPGNSSSSTTSAMAINAVESINGGEVVCS